MKLYWSRCFGFWVSGVRSDQTSTSDFPCAEVAIAGGAGADGPGCWLAPGAPVAGASLNVFRSGLSCKNSTVTSPSATIGAPGRNVSRGGVANTTRI